MATKEDIKQEILDVIVLFTDPEWMSMTPRRKVQVALLEISECAAQVLGALDPDARDVKLPVFIEVAEELFDEYIQPIDLPVNDFIEKWVDKGMREQIGPTLYKLMDWMDK